MLRQQVNEIFPHDFHSLMIFLLSSRISVSLSLMYLLQLQAGMPRRLPTSKDTFEVLSCAC